MVKPGSICKYDLPFSGYGSENPPTLLIVIKKDWKFTGNWLLYDVKNSSLVHATAAWTKSNLTEVT